MTAWYLQEQSLNWLEEGSFRMNLVRKWFPFWFGLPSCWFFYRFGWQDFNLRVICKKE
ncbi:hypothetical protein ACQUWN_11715 [Rossellomorea aquimaris]|uniref:hypothetical protein n=1 Tax=Rossellomorea TaxID=2837508 RepID=UPI0016538496|nr:hypothetical protein [Rossellomorea vietnamensis]